MVETTIEKFEGKLIPEQMQSAHKTAFGHQEENHTDYTSTNFISNDPVEAKIMVASCLALMVGILQVDQNVIIEICVLFFSY